MSGSSPIQPRAPHRSASSPALTIALDASRSRSGGAKAHLLGILKAVNPREHGIASIHVWSYAALLAELPNEPWLVKHNPPALEGSLLRQVWWQYRHSHRELRENNCHVLLSTDAGSVSKFTPSVVMSRDMLAFEPNESRRFGLSFARLRLLLLRHLTIRALRRATGALFLTGYASTIIQRATGKLNRAKVIPHGIGEAFRQPVTVGQSQNGEEEICCVYVSNVDMYKHQWQVVKAIAILRAAGHPVSLKLVGGRGAGRAKALLDEAVAREDASGNFVEIVDAVPHSDIPKFLAKADIFIFASSCENMPNTLVEGMASGRPIACSNKGPMPEILRNGGTYFDPEDPTSIANAVEQLIVDVSFRRKMAETAQKLSADYSWKRCATETWAYLNEVYFEHTCKRNKKESA